jgi:hypothetical protein
MYGNKLKRFSRYLRRTIAVLISANLICGLFGCSRTPSSDPSDQDVAMALKDIWEIESHNELIIELDNYVSAKCGYGENMDRMSPAERIFYLCQTVEKEVNNGGFDQYYLNYGNYANDTPDALRAISAAKTAELVDRANSLFTVGIPQNMKERQKMLERFRTEEIIKRLSECDTAIYEYEEDLTELNYNYVMANRSRFS